MPGLDSAVRYGGSGAAIGTSIGGPIGTAIGGGIGFLAGLFGGSDDEEERQKRFREFLAFLGREKRNKAIETAKMTSGLMQQATASAAERARASGRDAEDAIIPAQESAARVGTETMRRNLEPYDRAKMDATRDFADRPMEPGTLDYLEQAGGAVANAFENNRLIDAMNKMGPMASKTNIPGETVPGDYTPEAGGGVNPIAPPGEQLAMTTPAGSISRHRKRDMDYNPLFDDDYLNSLYS